jgi:hypothetical protein
MASVWKQPKVIAGTAVLVFSMVYLYWISGDVLRTAGDEGIYLEGARRVAQGQQPYRDFFVLTGPLTFWMEGILAHISGMSLIAMRLPLIVETTFMAWAVYWLMSRYADAWFSAGTALAFLAYGSRYQLLFVNHRWDSAALATAAIVAALGAKRSTQSRLWISSGFLAAAAAWATPSLGIVMLPLLWWSMNTGRRFALRFVAGGAIGSLAAVLYLQTHQALIPMIRSLVWTGAHYTRANSVTYGSAWLGMQAAGLHVEGVKFVLMTLLIIVPAVLTPAAIVGWGWYWYRGRNRADASELMPLLAAAAALVLAAWPRWTSDAILHTMAVSWFLCALLLYRVAPAQIRFWCAGLLLLVCCFPLPTNAMMPLNYWPRETRVGTLRDPDNEVEFLESLQRWIKPGDSLFVYPYMPSLYYFLDARNPTRYTFLQPGMMSAEDEQGAIADLEAAPPRWVLYENFPAKAVLEIWPNSDPALIPMTALNTYLQQHYHRVDTITGPRAHLELMERTTPSSLP